MHIERICFSSSTKISRKSVKIYFDIFTFKMRVLESKASGSQGMVKKKQLRRANEDDDVDTDEQNAFEFHGGLIS